MTQFISYIFRRMYYLICILILVLICTLEQLFFDKYENSYVSPVKLILITPTYQRPERLADMTRTSQTLMHIKNLHWIVIEDGDQKVSAVEQILLRSGLEFSYLIKKGPRTMKLGHIGSLIFRTKGVKQRDFALDYIRGAYANYANDDAVIFYADDDNSYDLRLFREYLPQVKTIGFWAVGLAGSSFVEAPKVENGTIVGWQVRHAPSRKFASDMAGFGIHLKLILRNKNASFANCIANGQRDLEDCFLQQMDTPWEKCQAFGYDTKQVLVWHTKTAKVDYMKKETYGYTVVD